MDVKSVRYELASLKNLNWIDIRELRFPEKKLRMKVKMNSSEALREFQKRYAEGLTDEELKKNWIFVRESNLNLGENLTSMDFHVHRLREDFDRAVKRNSLENAEKIMEWFKTQPFLPKPTRKYTSLHRTIIRFLTDLLITYCLFLLTVLS